MRHYYSADKAASKAAEILNWYGIDDYIVSNGKQGDIDTAIKELDELACNGENDKQARDVFSTQLLLLVTVKKTIRNR